MYSARKRVAAIPRSSMGTNPNSSSARPMSPVPLSLRKGVEMVMPGDNTKMKIKLIYPIALEEGMRFRDS